MAETVTYYAIVLRRRVWRQIRPGLARRRHTA